MRTEGAGREGGGRGGGGDNGGGEAEIDVGGGGQEGVCGGDEGRMLGTDRCERGAGRDVGEGIRAPEREDVVAHDEVVGLLGAAYAREDGGGDLVLGEGVRGEPRRDGDVGLGVELPRQAEGGVGWRAPTAARDAGEMRRGRGGRGGRAEDADALRGDHVEELLLAAAALPRDGGVVDGQGGGGGRRGRGGRGRVVLHGLRGVSSRRFVLRGGLGVSPCCFVLHGLRGGGRRRRLVPVLVHWGGGRRICVLGSVGLWHRLPGFGAEMRRGRRVGAEEGLGNSEGSGVGLGPELCSTRPFWAKKTTCLQHAVNLSGDGALFPLPLSQC
jgi:hypothetical protein